MKDAQPPPELAIKQAVQYPSSELSCTWADVICELKAEDETMNECVGEVCNVPQTTNERVCRHEIRLKMDVAGFVSVCRTARTKCWPA